MILFLLGEGRGVPEPPRPTFQTHHWLKHQGGHGSILVPREQCMCNFCHNYQKLQEELIGLHTPDQMFQLRTCLIISLARLQFLLLHLLICLHNTLVMKIQGLVSNIHGFNQGEKTTFLNMIVLLCCLVIITTFD